MLEVSVNSLIDCGWGYDQIKEFIQKRNFKNDFITTAPYRAVVILLPKRQKGKIYGSKCSRN